MTNFFEQTDYKMPVTSNYMKFKDGVNTFRVLSSAIVGYEYFKDDNKPVRSRHDFDGTPGIKKDGEVKHFWAFAVWNYEAERIQILELTQKGIMSYMQSLINNKKWGNPTGYDITVTKTGAGLKTEYDTMAEPHSVVDNKISEAWSKCKIDLTELYEGGDPFKPSNSQANKPAEEVAQSVEPSGYTGEVADTTGIDF